MKHLLISLILTITTISAAAGQQELTQEIADRYEQMLLQNPSAGTAFERVVEWYAAEGGGLEALRTRWSKAAETDSTPTASCRILLGMLSERQRKPGQARAEYDRAMKSAADPTKAARALASLEATEGNFDAAAAAWQLALKDNNLPMVDRMEIMRSLALLFQRAFQEDKALKIWRDAVDAFPDDPLVLEEAGDAFLAAQQYAEARKIFTALRAKSEKDPWRRISASFRLAKTAEAEGNIDEALTVYDGILADSSEGSWLRRESRSRIERLFRDKNDLPGLLAWYEKRIEKEPKDVQARAAAADVLFDLNRDSEAIQKIRSATELAPGDSDLRRRLATRLAEMGSLNEAIKEAEDAASRKDASAESHLLVGNLLWRRLEKSQDKKDRMAAIAAWQQIAPEGSTDLPRVTQLANVYSSNQLDDLALAAWQRATELAPDVAESRQREAEIWLRKGDQAAAEKALRGLVEGDRATPANYLALARTQIRLKLARDAENTLSEGLAKFPQDYELLSFAWRRAIENNDDARVSSLFPRVWDLAPNAFFAEDTVRRYVLFLQARNEAKTLTANLLEQASAGTIGARDAELLFRLSIAMRDEEASEAALAALRRIGTPLQAARAAADHAQAFEEVPAQVEALKAVAKLEPRMAPESLRSAARILASSGETDEALAILSSLIERSPADAALYREYANTASQAGRTREAEKILRDALRYVEEKTAVRMQLAEVLMVQGRSQDAEKILEEAFEDETQEPRRRDIFRRRAELALMSGTADQLVESLRAKQAKEQGGARYGSWLAEIYLLQNDFLAAREELEKGAGSNPNDPQILARLLELSERGGDKEEALRLSERLVELEPTQANQAAHLMRLLESGKAEDARLQVESYRQEIVKDPSTWAKALEALAKAGQQEMLASILAEIETSADAKPSTLVEGAKAHILSGDFPEASRMLWAVVERPDFGDAVEAVIGEQASAPFAASPFQPSSVGLALSRSEQEARQAVHYLLSPSGQRYFGGLSWRMAGALQPGAPASEDQKAQVRALFFLKFLSSAYRTEKAFTAKAAEVLGRSNLDRAALFLLFRQIGAKEQMQELVQLQAENPSGGVATDREMAIALGESTSTATSEAVTRIKERIAATDASVDAELQFRDLQRNFQRLPNVLGTTLNAPQLVRQGFDQAKLREELQRFAANPARPKTLEVSATLASLAAVAGDRPAAQRLLDEAEEIQKTAQPSASSPLAPSPNYTLAMLRLRLLHEAIVSGEEVSADSMQKTIDSITAGIAGSKVPTHGSVFSGGTVFFSGPHAVAGGSNDLRAGDSRVPLSAFRRTADQSPQHTERLREWYAGKTVEGPIDDFGVALFYLDWANGERSEALKSLSARHSAHPSPRSAALLLEVLEAEEKHAEALALIDEAPLQPGENADSRAVRKLRLLRQAGRTEEARSLGEKMARSRVSYLVRQQLASELQALGMPEAQKLSGMLYARRSMPSRDPGEQLRQQVRQLMSDGKTDEAEALVARVLDQPLPNVNDFRTMQLRNAAGEMLREMKRSAGLRQRLEERLAKDPGDFGAAVRLVEVDLSENPQANTESLLRFVESHPVSQQEFRYALRLLQQKGRSEAIMPLLVAAISKGRNGGLFRLMQEHEILSWVSNSKSLAPLAEAVAALDDDDYRDLFLTSRLTMRTTEIQVVAQLAEAAAREGKPALALALLERLRPQLLEQLSQGLPWITRLLELQIANGEKENARELLGEILADGEPEAARPVAADSNLARAFQNILANSHMPGSSEELIRKFLAAAESAEMLDAVLDSLDKSPMPGGQLSASLLARTILGRPGIGKEWREVIRSGSAPSLNASQLASVISSLAELEDSGTLIPALLKGSLKATPGFSNGHLALRSLARILPSIQGLSDDETVRKFVRAQTAAVLQDTNTTAHMIHSNEYVSCLEQLVQAGFAEEAQAMLDATAAQRQGNRSSHSETLDLIETQLKAQKGGTVPLLLEGVVIPRGDATVRVRWQAAVAPPESTVGRRTACFWSENRIALPVNSLPKKVELFAGPNPARMKSVAESKGGKGEGAFDFEVETAAGLVQLAWTMPDGSRRWGSLIPYALGHNYARWEDPSAKAAPALSASDFKPGLPGPFGKESAVGYAFSAAQNRRKVPLAELEVPGGDHQLLVSGWVAGTSNRGYVQASVALAGSRENSFRWSDHIALASGRWVSFWNVLDFPAGQKERAIDVSLSVQSSAGMNGMWQFEGAWDGLQVVVFEASDARKEAQQILQKARAAAAKKDYAAAANGWLEAIETDPGSALSQSPEDLIAAFEKASMAGKLFAALSIPALYLPNPFHNGRPALDNTNLQDRLLRLALQPDAPAQAKRWLGVIESAELPEGLRLNLEVKLSLNRNAGKPDAKEILTILGFAQNGLRARRIAEVWMNPHSGPAKELLEAVEKESLEGEVLSALDAMKTPESAAAARLQLEAWLLCQSDPRLALKKWRASREARRTGRNIGSFSDDADRALLLKVAEAGLPPGDVIAELQGWLASRRGDPAWEARRRADALHALAAIESEHRAEYAKAWVEAELAAVDAPGYRAPSGRLRQLARQLREAQDWTNLQRLVDKAEKQADFSSPKARAELQELKNLAAIARGDVGRIWPVAWRNQAAKPGDGTLKFQWAFRNTVDPKSEMDAVVAVAENPPMSRIPNQQRVEFRFAEMPDSLMKVAEIEGDAALGEAQVELPSRNGFLQAVAVVDGKEIAGPIVPVITGRRIFPAEGEDLVTLLQGGSRALPSGDIRSTGEAPDGSPAVRIGGLPGDHRFDFNGAEIPVEPGKFYVARCWLRRAQDGSGWMNVQYQGKEGERPLSMVLASQPEPAGEWILYTRAVPTLPQWTFWIPWRNIQSVVPRFGNLPGGSDVAGWELLEVSDWAYGRWLAELSTLRQEQEDSQGSAKVPASRIVELAAVEPLSSLDYHGSWIVEQLIAANQPGRLPELFRTALSADPNPLLPIPKTGRIFGSLKTAIESTAPFPQEQEALVTLMLEHGQRAGPGRTLDALRALLASRPEGESRENALRKVRAALLENGVFGKPDELAAKSLTSRTFSGRRPKSEWVELVISANDPALLSGAQGLLAGPAAKSLSSWVGKFALLCLLPSLDQEVSDEDWNRDLKAAFASSTGSESATAAMFWPLLLSDTLAARKGWETRRLEVCQMTLEKALSLRGEAEPQNVEILRAGANLIEAALAVNDQETARMAAAKLQKRLAGEPGAFSSPSRAALIDTLDMLTAANLAEERDALLVPFARKIHSSERLKKEFQKYLDRIPSKPGEPGGKVQGVAAHESETTRTDGKRLMKIPGGDHRQLPPGEVNGNSHFLSFVRFTSKPFAVFYARRHARA